MKKNIMVYIIYIISALPFHSYAQYLELVKNISLGTGNSEVVRSIVDGENIFLVLKNADNSQSLWFYNKQQNTSTHLFKDSTHTNTSHPFGRLTLWNHKVFFAFGSIFSRQLWVSDGTVAGTIKLNDNIGSFAQSNLENESYSYGKFMPANNILYFYTKTTGSYGSTELWRTDGTIVGTYLIDYTNNYNGMAEDGSKNSLFYFQKYATFNISGSPSEIWVTNGINTSKVATVFQNSNNGNFKIENFQDYSLVMVDSVNHISIFSVGGTTPSIQQIQPKVKSSNFYYAYMKFGYSNGKTVFNWCGTPNNQEIWQTDGTASGTFPITNAVNDNISFEHNGNIENYYLFSGYMGNNTYEKYFGIVNIQTNQIKYITAPNSSYPLNVYKKIYAQAPSYVPKVFINNKFYFIETYGKSILEVDANGTTSQAILPINSPFSYNDIYGINNRLLIHRVEDNKNEDVMLIKKINTSYNLTDSLTFKPTQLRPFNNSNSTLYFMAYDTLNGKEIWTSNGTSIGSFLMKDFNSLPNSSNPTKLQSFGNGVFFLANDGKYDTEPWFTEGTSATTILKHDIFGIVTPYLSASTKFGNFIYNLHSGNVLTKYDLTNKSFVMNTALSIGPVYDTQFELMNGDMYFAGYSTGSGIELYKLTINGSASMVRDLYYSSSAGSYPLHLKAVNNTLFFSTSGQNTGRELYKSDGSYSGTILVKDINPGYGDTNFSDFNSFQNQLIFLTDSSKIWRSDGTANGTVILQDFGASAKILAGFKEFQGGLYFGVKGTNNDGLYRITSNLTVEYVSALNFTNSKKISFHGSQNTLYFSTNTDLYKLYNFTTTNLYAGLEASEFTNAFGQIYFRGCLNGECEIWKINQNENISKVFDINEGSRSSDPKNLLLLGRNLYFSAYRPDVGTELFKITDCPTSLSQNTQHLLSQKLEAGDEIRSSAKINTVINVTYDAGKAIYLQPGFEASNGSVFKAYMNGCIMD